LVGSVSAGRSNKTPRHHHGARVPRNPADPQVARRCGCGSAGRPGLLRQVCRPLPEPGGWVGASWWPYRPRQVGANGGLAAARRLRGPGRLARGSGGGRGLDGDENIPSSGRVAPWPPRSRWRPSLVFIVPPAFLNGLFNLSHLFSYHSPPIHCPRRATSGH